MEVSESEIRQQSLSCYRQWADQWREHCKIHGDRFEMHSMQDFHQIGVGRAVLCIANGASFEENLEVIQKYQGNVDIVACDKTVKHCLDHGIVPNYVILCDANVSYEKYCEPVKDKLQDTILIANVCSNPKWAINGNWKKVYFFVNKDCLESEKEFQQISGCQNVVVAGTNVSNAMIIILTQCDNHGPQNFFGYDKILLIGFDYCWRDKYYAFDHDGGGKINYLRNVYLKNLDDDYCYTSPNLLFSAKWISKYLKTFRLPVVQCSNKTIVDGLANGSLEKHMQYEYCPDDSHLVRKLVKIRNEKMNEAKEIDERLNKIAYAHYLQFQKTA